MFNHIRIVLFNLSHPGNIGATVRYEKHGLLKIVLGSTRIFPHEQATARAAGADDILAQAIVVDDLNVDDLNTVLKGYNSVYGSSARDHTLTWPLKTVRWCGKQVVTQGG